MLKIGVVPYINALPLYRYLPYPVVMGTPAELDRKMTDGELDAALLPIFSFFKNPSYQPLFEAGVIQSCGPVESVALFYREKFNRPSQIKSIKYSEESITSVALFKVIYSLFWKQDLSGLKSQPLTPDAHLHIGDKALFFNEPGYKTLDLGDEWTKQTGLPFVYAAWVSRKPLPRETIDGLIAAKKEGLARREEIVRGLHDFHNQPQRGAEGEAPSALPMEGAMRAPIDRLRTYLTKSIQYDVTLKSLEGIEKFRDMCFEVGLLKEKRKLES